MRSLVRPGSQTEQIGRLFVAVLVVMSLPALPFGHYLTYPFVILTTWFHEMGHGMTALLMGQDFEQLAIYADGSGVAQSRVETDISPFARAAIAAGGPLAPCIIGSILIALSAHEKWSRPALWTLAAIIVASVLIYVRSTMGIIVLPLVATTIAFITWKASSSITRFTLQFLGVLGALSMLRDFNYLFTEKAVIGGQVMLSDTGQIEANLLLPYWFWAVVILAMCAIMVGASLKYALNGGRLNKSGPKPPANVLQFKRTKR